MNNETLNIDEKGRLKDGTIIYSNKRLFMQFLAFGNVSDHNKLVSSLKNSSIESVLYFDLNDPKGVGLLVLSDDPNYFVDKLRDFLNNSPFSDLFFKDEYTMFGRTYSFGYEDDLERTLISGPREKVFNPDMPWAIWYPLRRDKSFEALSDEEQRSILGEHGKVGFKYGRAGFAKDIRLACHGLDKNDNDFVIGVLGAELYPLSSVIQRMRKTKQTAMHLESLGPFFIGKALFQTSIK